MRSQITRAIVFAMAAFALVTAHGQTEGFSAETLVLGRILPRTGVLAGESKIYADGMDVLFDRINKAGGIHGRKIVAKDYDDAYSAERRVSFVAGTFLVASQRCSVRRNRFEFGLTHTAFS